MITEKHIYNSARQVIENCGIHYSAEYASLMSCVLSERGNVSGATVWAKIGDAVQLLLNIGYDGILH